MSEASRRSELNTSFHLLASSWDTDLVDEIGKAMGAEAREYGVDILLMPGTNLHCDPRGGASIKHYTANN